MKKVFYFILLIAPTFYITACNQHQDPDNQTSGNIKVSIDESYKPIMEEQLKVFFICMLHKCYHTKGS